MMRKMNKDERYSYIRKRADELARTGDYLDYSFIEIAIRSEGLEDARSVLDDTFIRDQLDKVCEIAQSPQEMENRKRFDKWISNFVQPSCDELRKGFPTVSITFEKLVFAVSIGSNRMDVYKSFGSRKLVGTFHFTAEDENHYKSENITISPKNFDEFELEDLMKIVHQVSVKKY